MSEDGSPNSYDTRFDGKVHQKRSRHFVVHCDRSTKPRHFSSSRLSNYSSIVACFSLSCDISSEPSEGTRYDTPKSLRPAPP